MYLARSVTGLLRAVKIVRRADFELEKTFEREFQGIQRYEEVSRKHAGLVDVFQVGRNDKAGFYYYVMELADDLENGDEDIDVISYEPRTLAQDLKQHRQRPIRECVEIGMTITEALGHLHAATLTHRDVKPSNIIFVKGQPCLADIGLVAQTGQRTYVGTEGYVPPEGPGSSSADLYSVAMILYEMVTGKDRLEFPELPTNMELPPTINRDEFRAINTVICRAGAPDARKRFESAHALKLALQKVLEDDKHVPHTGGKRKIAAAVAGIIALLGVGAFALHKTGIISPGPDTSSDFVDTGSLNTNTLTSSETQENNPNSFTPAAPTIDPFAALVENSGGSNDPLPSSFTNSEGAVVFSDPAIEFSNPPDPDAAADESESRETEPETEDAGQDDGPEWALFRISSRPSGASVFRKGESTPFSVTPTPFLKFETGPVELVLKLDGYHEYPISRSLEGSTVDSFTLMPDKRPVPGKDWVNSLGIPFHYEGGEIDTFYSSEIPREPYHQFQTETGRPVAIAVPIGTKGTLGKSPRELWAFCDWMTAKDRAAGFLGDDQYFAHQPAGGSPHTGAFICRIDDRSGSILIGSEPQGAAVMRHGKEVGDTPLTLSQERLGAFSFELVLAGYQKAFVDGVVEEGRLSTETVELVRDGSVVFGESWVNSIGMKFAPVKDFMASVYETRVSDFSAFLETEPEGVEAPQPGFPQGKDHPVSGILISDAEAFCEWLTEKDRAAKLIKPTQKYRLPTDIEWSALAGLENEKGETPEERDSKIPDHYPWGKQWPPGEGSGNLADQSAISNTDSTIPDYDDGYPLTSPVGTYQPNEFGLYDLSGNVWEWVQDRYSNPQSSIRVGRGGDWSISTAELFVDLLSDRHFPDSARGRLRISLCSCGGGVRVNLDAGRNFLAKPEILNLVFLNSKSETYCNGPPGTM